MSQQENPKLPINLLVLEFFGSILLTLGIVDWISDLKIMPVQLQFNHYEFVLIVIGFLLTLPFILFLFNRVLGKQTREI